jgi:SEC-C motif
MASPWGTQLEHTVKRIAANLGVPDFVYEPANTRKGSATREISDGMLIVQDRGVILQCKARSPESNDDDQRIESWIEKNIDKAAKQIAGTRRTLRTNGETSVTSLRGYTKTVTIDEDWPGVPANFRAGDHLDGILVMTLEDWLGLHEMLLSTSGVIRYNHRAIEAKVSVYLGCEAARYVALASADAQATASTSMVPELPMEPLSEADRLFAAVVDEWIEEIGGPPTGPMPWSNPDEQRLAVAVLDAMLPLHRATFGKKLLMAIDDAEASGNRRSGFLRVEPGVGSAIFYVDVASSYANPDDEVHSQLLRLAFLRHEQLWAAGRDPGPTLAIARVSNVRSGVLRSFVLLSGKPDSATFDPEVRWASLNDFGILDLQAKRVRRFKPPGRNGLCPCGSSLKFKRCHGIT